MKPLIACWMSALMSLNTMAAGLPQVEPPNWWVGMREPALQLMLHAPGVAEAQVTLAPHPGVRWVGSHRASSPNYLFVDLSLAADTPPGMLALTLTRAGHAPLALSYPLLAREPGSAERQGFGPRDAIYLVVPDRFAQGGSSSSSLSASRHGMKEGLNRADPGGRHGGDLAGLRQHLGYIAGLGFTQIWPTPLLENNGAKYSYHGYAATDFYRVDPRFGSHADYRAFVTEARAAGLGVIQDVVLNHIGADHGWMADLPAPDWVNQWPEFTETHHARLTLQDPYAAPSDRRRFTDGWFSPGMPDLNQRRPELATYLTQMTLWWIESAGLSGIRTDTWSYSDKDFLTHWSARVLQEYPRLNIVGEEWSPHPAVVAYWQRGHRNTDGYVSHAPSLMDFPLHGALIAALNEADSHDSGFTKLYEALAHDFLYADPANLVLFDGNHDTPRLVSALKGDAALARMALAYLATTRRIPQMFYGSELLLTSPAQRDDGRVRADMPGGWPGDPVNAFTGVGLTAAQRDMQAWVQRLFTWRKTAGVIHNGALMQYAPMDGCYVFFRYDAVHTVMVVLNKNDQPVELALARFAERVAPGMRARDVLSGQSQTLGEQLRVPARSPLILEVER